MNSSPCIDLPCAPAGSDCNGDGIKNKNDPYNPDYDKTDPGSDPDGDGIPNEDDQDDDGGGTDDDEEEDNETDPYDPTDDGGGGSSTCSVKLSGPTSVREGQTITVTASAKPANLVASYEWAITYGAAHAAIVGGQSGAAINLLAVSAGWVEVKVWVEFEDDPEDEADPCDVQSAIRVFEVKSCPCGSFIINGPNYVGVHAPIVLGLEATPEWTTCSLPPTVWEVIAGEALLEPGAPGSGLSYSRTAAAAAGDVTFRATYTQGGVPCMVQKTARVVEYKPVTLHYAAFIPCEVIEGPLPGGGLLGLWPYFGGDNRSYDATSHEYRAGFHLQAVRVSDHWGIPSPSISNSASWDRFGVSKGYLTQDVVQVSTQPNTCHHALAATALVRDQGLANSPPSLHEITFSRIQHNTIRITFTLAAVLPLIEMPGTCSIDAALQFEISQLVNPANGTQEVEVYFTGTRNDFPAHEAYIHGRPLMQFNPITAGYAPWQLCIPSVGVLPVTDRFVVP